MPRTFEVAITSPHSTRQVFDAFAAAAYWHDRYAAFESSTTLDELDRTSTPDGESVRLVMTEDLRADRLPSLIGRVYPGELKVRTTEHWQVGADDRVHGTIEITVLGAPGSARACSYRTRIRRVAHGRRRHRGGTPSTGRGARRECHRRRIPTPHTRCRPVHHRMDRQP